MWMRKTDGIMDGEKNVGIFDKYLTSVFIVAFNIVNIEGLLVLVDKLSA